MSETAETDEKKLRERMSPAEIGALAHLYRGEIYRSTTWRTRLDATTNWSVVSLGIALSLSFSGADASPLPLILVGALIFLFLWLESRRYRYFNVWRARARWLEINFYAPMLQRQYYEDPEGWQDRLAKDYLEPEHHISFMRAFGRRLRRNYMWIYVVHALAMYGKVMIHPAPASSFADFTARLTVGPAPGVFVFIFLVGCQVGLAAITYAMWRFDKKKHRERRNPISMG